jgi:hypothetical protein
MTIATLHLARKTKPQPGDKRYGRSKVANGSALVPGVDGGHSLWVRRLRDQLNDFKSAVPDATPQENAIIRRASVLIVELERMERAFALAGEAEPQTLDLYARIAANMRRLLESVGLRHRQKDVPTLADYLATRKAEQQAETAS